MNRAVLDASVLLAAAQNEPADLNVISGAVLSTVNLAEVLTKVGDLGPAVQNRLHAVLSLLDRTEPFTQQQARTAAQLRPLTRSAGLSLGDRACLALALELDFDVYTTDRVWATLRLPCRVHLIR